MPKVLLHNLTIPFRQYDQRLFDFDQNSVFFTEKGDVMVTRKKISEEYLSFLERIGFDISSLTFIFSAKQLEGPAAIFEDRDIIDDVRQLVKQNKGQWKLDSYMLTDKESHWAKETGLSFAGDPSHYYLFGNKSMFRALAKKHGLSIPVGFENLQGFLDGAIAVASLFAKGFPEIVIKQDEGVAGLGSLRLTFGQFLSRLFGRERLFPEKSGWGVVPLHSSGFVAEAWYQNTVLSPSLQFYIHNNADCQLISTHCQLFGDNKMTYHGCLSQHWIPQDIRSKLENEATAFTKVLAAKGVRGHLSFNAILLDDGKVFWTEINARRVSSSYPFQIVKKIGGRDADKLPYISRRVRKESWKTKSIGQLLSELSPVLFSPRLKTGIIPYDMGRLNSQGEISVLAVGETQNEVLSLFNYVVEDKFQYRSGIAIRALGKLEEMGVIELLAKNSQGLSAKEIAERLGLIPSLLEPVCDFISVNLPAIIRKEDQRYFFDKKTYSQNFWGRLNFLLAYEPVFSNLSQLLRGEGKYGKNIRRRGKYLERSNAIYNAKAWQQIIEILKKNNPHTIIDLGCGSAEFLTRACWTLPDTFGIGVEIDEELAMLARGKVKEQKLSGRIRIVQGDAAKPEELIKHLTFKPGPVKIALVGITIWHEFLINPEKFLVELFSRYRSCFPGSIFIIAEYNGFSFKELINLPQSVRESASFYQLVHPLTNQGLPQSPEKWRAILRQAGFSLRESMAVEPNLTIYTCG